MPDRLVAGDCQIGGLPSQAWPIRVATPIARTLLRTVVIGGTIQLDADAQLLVGEVQVDGATGEPDRILPA